jgi:thioredoxin-related protein
MITGFSNPSENAVEQEVEWISFEEAIIRMDDEPRKILIDIYTDWCGWCKKMDRDTYAKSAIVSYINKNYYAVKFNAEQREDVIFSGHTFKFVPSGKRGYHELAAALTRNQLSYPTTVFMDENKKIIQSIPGYQDAKSMDMIIHFLGEDVFKSTPWEDFQQSYKSSL